MFLNNLEDVAYERQKALREEAEQMWLIKIVQRRQSNKQRVLRKVLNWTGAQMANWGYHLQACYDAAVEPAVSDSSVSQS